MSAKEWAGIKAALVANWPHSQLPEVSLKKWKRDLDEFPAEQVLVAVESLYREGREFAPNGALIRKQVLGLASDMPPWSEVWHRVDAAIANYGHWHEDSALAYLHDYHPLAERLAVEIGWRHLCLCEDAPTTVEAQCRGKWEQMVARSERDGMLQGLPSAGLRRLERVNREPRKISFREAIEAPK